ncbi:MAG: Trp biosynthesis-associated membrane protein [Nocardioidaceae bacterium]
MLVGLTAAVLAAVAAARDWATASGAAAGVEVTGSVTGSSTAPLAVSLALVTLAAWGVVLVLRGRTRRVAAVAGTLAAAGVLAATVVGFGTAPDDALAAVVSRGGTGRGVSTSLTAWYWTCAVAALVATAAFAVAVRAAPAWPAMGSRYDAPAGRPDPSPAGEQDLWRALDDGRDPTE